MQAGDLQRQFCCRLFEDLSTSNHFFLHHPFIGRPSIYACPSSVHSNKSVNWIINNPKVEYINPMTGLATEELVKLFFVEYIMEVNDKNDFV